jgi:hypothetical protein
MMKYSFEEKNVKTKREKTVRDESSLLPKNYKSIFEKLWAEVEDVVSDFRNQLFKSLADMTNTPEAHEKILGYLSDLDSKQDPHWAYLELQYSWILKKISFLQVSYAEINNGFFIII